MRKFSTKAEVVKLVDLEVDKEAVFLRGLSAGDKVKLAAVQGELISASKNVQSAANDDEDLKETAQRVLTKEQFIAWVSYTQLYVFLRWSDGKGKRKYANRTEFDELPAELIDAIYAEAQKADPEESAEEAEKNS